MGASRHHQLVVLGRAAGQPSEYRECLVPNELQPGAHLQLLDVLGHVAAGHALVDLLLPGKRRELLDPGLDVVAGNPLPGRDRVQVDVVDHRFVGRDRTVRNIEAEVFLGAQDSDPESSFEDDLVFRRPQRGHGHGMHSGQLGR